MAGLEHPDPAADSQMQEGPQHYVHGQKNVYIHMCDQHDVHQEECK